MHRFASDADWSFLHDLELQQVCVGVHDVQLRFDDGTNAWIWGGFQHTGASGAQDESDRVQDQAKSLLSLLGSKVRSVSVLDPTALRIEFTNDEALTIRDDSDAYESARFVSKIRDIVV